MRFCSCLGLRTACQNKNYNCNFSFSFFDCVFHARAIELRYDHVHSHASVSFFAAESCAALTDVNPGLCLLPGTVTEEQCVSID